MLRFTTMWIFLLLDFDFDLEPRKVPTERCGVPPFYWDVEFY